MIAESTRRLKPPKNFRHTAPRCCGLCRYSYLEGDYICCERLPEGKQVLADADNYYTIICDRYEAPK